MSALQRIHVRSTARLVTLQGAPVRLDGPEVLLHGVTDSLTHAVCAVRLDDGREFLVAREDVEVAL